MLTLANIAEEQEQAHLTPKSIVRHRPMTTSPSGTRTQTISKARQPITQRASRPRTTASQTKPESEASTSNSSTPARTPMPWARTEPVTSPKTRQKGLQNSWHPLTYLGLGMTGMLLLWMLLSTALGWSQTLLDDMRYGRPRTFQMDAMVGHNEQPGRPSHFIALNLNRNIQIIEIAGGDPAHTHIYTGPQLYGAHDDLVPVTLSFLDVNGDHHPDMLITFQDSRIVYINDGDHFRPATPSEQPQIEQALKHLQS